jgi:hypothetical protein
MTSMIWPLPVLTHSAQSTYKPEPYSPSELATRSNLRTEGISELTDIINISSARLFSLTLLNTYLIETLHTRKAAVYPTVNPAVRRPLDKG